MKTICVQIQIATSNDEGRINLRVANMTRQVDDDVPEDGVLQDLASRLARILRTSEPTM